MSVTCLSVCLVILLVLLHKVLDHLLSTSINLRHHLDHLCHVHHLQLLISLTMFMVVGFISDFYIRPHKH